MLSYFVMRIRFSLLTPLLNTMKGCLIIYWMVLQFIPDTMGVLINSPCKKTPDWSNYHIRCQTNHTIYITKYVAEDGFNRLLFPALGCSFRDAIYCGVELPTINNISHKNYHILESAVNTCNGRNECTLTRQYFLDAEAALKKFCKASLRPELQEATFRQSIDYECVQDSQILHMCLRENERRHFNQPVFLKVTAAGCSCNLTGSVSRVEILQTIPVELLIYSNDSIISEQQDTGSINIPVQADNLIIKLQNGSKTSLAMMKVFSKGNISIQCQKERTFGSSHEQSNKKSTPELPKEISSFKGQDVEDTSSFFTTKKVILSVSVLQYATTRSFMNDISKATETELRDKIGLSNMMKFWIQGLIVILAAFVLMVIFLLLFSIIRQREDRNLLLTILQKLDDRYSVTIRKNSQSEFRQSRLSKDDKTYQEIPKQNICHPNTIGLSNPVYDTGCMVLENDGVEQDDVEGNVMSLESNVARSMLEDINPNGVYELQKII